jgi:CheY-specific phosphatase CheX
VAEATPALLAETLGATLEEAAFLFTEPEPSPPPFAAARVLEARIGFRGPTAGELRLVAEHSLARTLAANLLGEDDAAVLTTRAPDALGELLNMVVGLLVVRLFGDDARCRLGTPRVREIDPGEHAAGLARAACAATLLEEQGRRIDLALEVLPDGGGAP